MGTDLYALSPKTEHAEHWCGWPPLTKAVLDTLGGGAYWEPDPTAVSYERSRAKEAPGGDLFEWDKLYEAHETRLRKLNDLRDTPFEKDPFAHVVPADVEVDYDLDPAEYGHIDTGERIPMRELSCCGDPVIFQPQKADCAATIFRTEIDEALRQGEPVLYPEWLWLHFLENCGGFRFG